MIKAIVFDCFGVIYNDVANVAFDKLGGNKLKDRSFYHEALRLRSLGMINQQEMDQMMADGLGTTPEIWAEASQESTGRDERMMKLILQLRHDYKTGLVSNIGAGAIDEYFPNDEQEKYFDVVIASADVGIIKPDPRIYEMTAKNFGVEMSEIVFIDDNAGFIQVANDLGMKGIRFTSYSDLVEALNEVFDARIA